MLESIKLYLIAGALFIALLVGAGGMWAVTHARTQALENDLKTAQDAVETLTLAAQARDRADAVREAKRATVASKTQENHEALTQAVAAHRDWADQPVPDDVARVLRDAASYRAP